jgi:3-oxoacyl-[acyl-carrier-protein] synthase II
MPRRVVITSIGIASPIGLGVDAFWSALRAGRNGVQVFEDGELAAIPPGAGGRVAVPMKVAREFFDPRSLRNATMHGSTLHAVVATGDCLARSGLDDAVKPGYGCYVGTKQHYPPYAKQAKGALILAEGDGDGGWTFDDDRLGLSMRAQSAFDFLRTLPNMTGSHVSIRGGFQGPVCTFLGSTASGLQAVIEAWREIREGRAEGMLAAGAWTPYDTLYMGYLARRGLSAPRGETAAHPFDRRRRGMLPADGAAALLLEDLDVARARGATIVAELVGGASRFAVPGGDRDLAARVEALDAAIPDDLVLDAIGAEGVGHPRLDELEGRAWSEALGHDRAAAAHWIVPSACTGYSGPAASVLATAALALAMRDSVLPPLAGLDDPDPACGPVTPRPQERSAPVRGGAVSAFSFEGIHATLALQAWTGA